MSSLSQQTPSTGANDPCPSQECGVKIPVLQTSGEALIVEAGPEMTIREFKAELQRLRLEDPLMRKVTSVKLLVENQELLSDDGMVMDVVSPDTTVHAIFIERSIWCSNKNEANVSLKDATSLCSLYIPEDVSVIQPEAFSNCKGFGRLTIPESVTVIDRSAFGGCINLTRLMIPGSVSEIRESAFRDCSCLSSVTLPESVSKIEQQAFRGCTCLSSVTIPKSVNMIGMSAFRGCTSLTSFTIPESVRRIAPFTFRDCTGLTTVTIPNTVTEIAHFAFRGCCSLRYVTIPDSVTSIGEGAFWGCGRVTVSLPESLAKVLLDEDDRQDHCFRGCSLVKRLKPGSPYSSPARSRSRSR